MFSSPEGSVIEGTSDPLPYQTQRVALNGEDGFVYRIPVPTQGNYITRLHFAELYYGASEDEGDFIGTFYAEPLPQLGNVTSAGSGVGSYYTWVDQFNTLGLGANVPINTGNQSEGLLVLNDGEWVVLRVPYPMGFYTKWLDGRIDDPDAGWKGRGLWASISTRAPFHMEGGKGTTPKAYHFQLRPDPLAR
jgi:hypothetical protein